MGPMRWRNSTPVIAGVVALVFVAVVVAATLFTLGGHGSGARARGPPARGPTVKPGVVPVANAALAPTEDGVAAALAAVAADPSLGRFGGRITDALTGKAVWSRLDDLPLVPASTNKVLTAAA